MQMIKYLIVVELVRKMTNKSSEEVIQVSTCNLSSWRKKELIKFLHQHRYSWEEVIID